MKGNTFTLLAMAGLAVALAAAQNPPSTSKIEIKGRVPVSDTLLRVHLPRPVTARLDNGMRLVIVENHRLPLAHAVLYIDGAGPIFEPRKLSGLASLTADMLSEGTSQRQSRELAVAAEKLGAAIETNSEFGSPYAQVTVSALGENLDQWLPLVADMVLHPSFPAAEFTASKEHMALSLRQQLSQPGFLAEQRFRSALFGEYPAAVTAPTPESLARIDRDLLVKWYSERYRPQNAILGISGNVDARQVIALARKYFGPWQKSAFVPALPPAPAPPRSRKLYVVDRPGSVQTTIMVGGLGIDRRSPDYVAVMVANRVLGENPTGRLFSNLREVHGWTYGAYSKVRAGAYAGSWAGSTDVRTEVTGDALSEFLTEVRRIGSEPVPAAELRQAKRAFVADFASSLESPKRLLEYYLESAIYDFPDDYWDDLPAKVMAVTTADVQRVAGRYLNPDALQIVAVGDRAKILPALRKYGPLQTAMSEDNVAGQRLTYPKARKDNQVDDYFGVKVADPYRWLENVDSQATKGWVQAENKVTNAYLAQISERAQLRKRLTELWNYERYGTPVSQAGRYFYMHNDGLQNQSVLYTATSLQDRPRELLDPNTLSPDGTLAVLYFEPSRDGKLLAYEARQSGSDWEEWRVRDVATGKDLPNVLRWLKFSAAAWTPDNKGFYYCRYDEPKQGVYVQANRNHKIYYHRLGNLQSEDRLVFEQAGQDLVFYRGARVTDDGRYLIISALKGASQAVAVWYQDLTRKDAPIQSLIPVGDKSFHFIDNDGPIFWFRTDLDAPRYKIIAIDIRKPERSHWKVVIPEVRETLADAKTINNTFVAHYLKDAHSELKVFDLQGKFLREISLPGFGTVTFPNGKRKDREGFYSFENFTTPRTVYRYDAVTGNTSVFRKLKLGFNPADYETRQVFYPSKDGTRIPMYITAKKGLKLDGNNPTVLYGYGGFNNPFTPEFSVGNLAWMELGGIYALANIRGGGEYGQEWHRAGMKTNKQNVFDDFIAAAEWLITNHYTSTPKLAIYGQSNGGLLMGACLAQRPDLFGAVLPSVGVLDMLRFQKFTVGWAWVPEYGSSDNRDEFKTLYAYSPLHNVKPGTSYPPTMILTADHDDRVVPGHSFKFAAALQAAQAGTAPILIRIETRAGHGGDRPTSKEIEEYTDMWGFLVKTLHTTVQPLRTGSTQ